MQNYQIKKLEDRQIILLGVGDKERGMGRTVDRTRKESTKDLVVMPQFYFMIAAVVI